MIERINKNEERLDNVLLCIKNLENALKEFKSNKKNIYLLNKYYGSNNWFKDKDAYEKKLIYQVKAGVLSEDTIWNMMDDIHDLLKDMQDIVNKFNY